MTDFTQEYGDLLIVQYFDKPKARAEIEAKASFFEIIRDVLADFPDQFNIDSEITDSEWGLFDGSVLGLGDGSVFGLPAQSAIGSRLDLIGKIVGLSRNQPNALSDAVYAKLLKVKIAQNNATGYMVSDDRISIQDVINLAFDGDAIATDKQDMSITLFINSTSITPQIIQLILRAKLLPKPAAVRYDVTANLTGELPFGMSEEGQPDDASISGLSELVFAPNAGGTLSEFYGA